MELANRKLFLYLAIAGALLFGSSAIHAQERLLLGAPGKQISALLFAPKALPEGAKAPAVVALHGCGGLGEPLAPRHADYAQLLSEAGIFVLMPDSFTTRGIQSICRERQRKVSPSRERVQDALAAWNYLSKLPQVDANAIGLLGWSNGASTVLYTVEQSRRLTGVRFSKAIAFYPGCSQALEREEWGSDTELLLLLGGKDNWTAAQPCEALARRAQARGQSVQSITYPMAVHNFDAPNTALRLRRGLAYTADGTGQAWVGTHPASREDAQARVVDFFRAK